jgi:nicotinamidase-related amidase
METFAGKAERSHNALLIIDVQVGLVELIPSKVKTSVLPRIKTLLAKPALREFR